jgi:hypothetical protein
MMMTVAMVVGLLGRLVDGRRFGGDGYNHAMSPAGESSAFSRGDANV